MNNRLKAGLEVLLVSAALYGGYQGSRYVYNACRMHSLYESEKQREEQFDAKYVNGSALWNKSYTGSMTDADREAIRKHGESTSAAREKLIQMGGDNE